MRDVAAAPSNLSKLPEGKRGKSASGSEIVIDLSSKSDHKTVLQFIKRRLPGELKSPMPTGIKPMLTSIADAAFNDKNWQFEIKWDGYRAVSYMTKNEVLIRSRNDLSFNEKFSDVHEALLGWGLNAVVDGEVVVLDAEGHADFEALQNWPLEQRGTLVYFVFDLLWLDGYNLMTKTLVERREILAQLVPINNVIRFSDSIDEAGIDFFKVARLNGLEGIIAKRKDAPYIPSVRTKNWYKIKAEERHEAVICGYTKKRGSSRLFSSLILGRPGKKGMEFMGQVGTGFSAAVQKHLFAIMNPLFTETCPFSIKPVTGAPTMWVKPQLVCEVKYTELTSEGVMRHPSFQGLREDKSLADLNLKEGAAKVSVGAVAETPVTPINKPRSVAKKPAKERQQVLVDMTSEHALVQVEQHELKFSNIQKFYWTKEKIRKGDLLNYYHGVAPYILPYMVNRPQSLNRHPNGIEGENFYHKDMKGKLEPWTRTHRRFSESTGEHKDFLVCNGEASLLYMANLGCIEMNPWHSRIQNPDSPDWSVIDLDPGENTFNEVIETALVVKKVLEHYGITSHVKTSGSTGLHIYVPFGAKYSYEQSKQFAELIANIVHDELPLLTSLERSPAKRKDKIYLDYLQNRPIQTICAPYSCRPKKGATVSAPLHWDEVKKGLSMSQFTIKNMVERVRSEGDLFTGVMGPGIDLSKVIQQLSETPG